MKKYLLVLMTLIAGAFLYTGCDLKNDSEFEEQLVLEGTLYVNNPLSVRITKTVPIFQYYDNSQLGVSGAEVHIWADGREFILPEDTSRPGTYALPADSHVVTTGVRYEFRADVNGTIITAVSDAAPAPLVIDTMNIAQWSDPANMDTIEFGEKIGDDVWLMYAHWNGDERNSGYSFIIENLEPDWFEEYRELSGNANGGFSTNLMMWSLRNLTDLQFPWIMFTCTGRHRIRVFSCNETAYNYMATSFPADPKYQPDSNVEGALGLFAAVGADTIYVYLKDDVEN